MRTLFAFSTLLMSVQWSFPKFNDVTCDTVITLMATGMDSYAPIVLKCLSLICNMISFDRYITHKNTKLFVVLNNF